MNTDRHKKQMFDFVFFKHRQTQAKLTVIKDSLLFSSRRPSDRRLDKF